MKGKLRFQPAFRNSSTVNSIKKTPGCCSNDVRAERYSNKAIAEKSKGHHLECVYMFTHKKVKVPKVNSLATMKHSCDGNVSTWTRCTPLLSLQMVHTRNVAQHHGIPMSWGGNTIFRRLESTAS